MCILHIYIYIYLIMDIYIYMDLYNNLHSSSGNGNLRFYIIIWRLHDIVIYTHIIIICHIMSHISYHIRSHQAVKVMSGFPAFLVREPVQPDRPHGPSPGFVIITYEGLQITDAPSVIKKIVQPNSSK